MNLVCFHLLVSAVLRALLYLLLVRSVGVRRGFALALLRTVIVP